MYSSKPKCWHGSAMITWLGTVVFVTAFAAIDKASAQKQNEYMGQDHIIDKDRELSSTFRDRIVGGEIAPTNRYPYMVQPAGSSTVCGGTLVWHDIVVTAAHCETDAWINGVWIGGNRFRNIGSNSSNAATRYGVKTSFSHPLYNSTISKSHDIRVVILSSLAPGPFATINTNRSIPFVAQLLTAIGYGLTLPNVTNSTPSNLMQVQIPTMNYTWCNRLWGKLVDDQDFCAGGTPEGGKDTCSGDSGSPILVPTNVGNTNYSNDIFVGITSRGSECAKPDAPAVYTRVSNYYSWLANVTCTMSMLPPTTGCPRVTQKPTRVPTLAPKNKAPTQRPTLIPLKKAPTQRPTIVPVKKVPTHRPTTAPIKKIPTQRPTAIPVKRPTQKPTKIPTNRPTSVPQTKAPTMVPTKNPTPQPVTKIPTHVPTNRPIIITQPTSVRIPTNRPRRTRQPTQKPTRRQPRRAVSPRTTLKPTKKPRRRLPRPTSKPTKQPRRRISRPTSKPTKKPRRRISRPTSTPTKKPRRHLSRPTSKPIKKPRQRRIVPHSTAMPTRKPRR